MNISKKKGKNNKSGIFYTNILLFWFRVEIVMYSGHKIQT